MASQLTRLTVFIASPSGLEAERKAFRDELHAYNDSEAMHRGVIFQPVGWEDTLGGVGRPQSLINKEVRACDFMLVLLYDRWGTSPDYVGSQYTSGTEEEFAVAVDAFYDAQLPMKQVVLLFKAPAEAALRAPTEQLERVLTFRRSIESERDHLFHHFDTLGEFRGLLRRLLGDWLRKHEQPAGEPEAAQAVEPGAAQVKSVSVGESNGVEESGAIRGAWELAQQGRFTEAELVFVREMRAHNRPEDMTSYSRLLQHVGRLDHAAEVLRTAVRTAREADNGDALSSALLLLGNTESMLGNHQEATKHYEALLHWARRRGDQTMIAKAYGSLGLATRVAGNLAAAERWTRAALGLFQQTGDSRGLMAAYGNLGTILDLRGKHRLAGTFLAKGVRVAEEQNDADAICAAHSSLAMFHRDRGRSDLAEAGFRRALEVAERVQSMQRICEACGALGTLLSSMRRRLDEAERFLERCVSIGEAVGAKGEVAAAIGNWGVVHVFRDEYDKAEVMFLKSLKLNEQLGSLDGMASRYSNLGTVAFMRGRYDDAEGFHRKAEALHRKGGSTLGVISALANIGLALEIRGQVPAAKQVYRTMLQTSEQYGDPHTLAKTKAHIAGMKDRLESLLNEVRGVREGGQRPADGGGG